MRKWQTFLPLIAIIILSIGLRLPLLGGSFWLDEAAQALESVRPLSQQLNIAYDFQPPLFHIVVHFFSLISYHEAWLRMPSLIAGIITIWATYQLGKKFGHPMIGILASILLATNSFHIFYSQELRPYSFAAMWGMLSWLILLGHTREKDTKAFWPFILFSLCSTAGLYSTYLYPFLLCSQLLFVFLFQPHSIKKTVLATLVTILFFLPWLPAFSNQLQVGSLLRVNTVGWDQVVSLSQLKSIPLTFAKFIFGVVDIKINFYFILATLSLGTGITYLFTHYIRPQKTRHENIIRSVKFCCAFFFPLLLAWVVCFFIPVIQPKRLLFLLPLGYLGFSSLLWSQMIGRNTLPQQIAQVLFALLLFVNIFGTTSYYLKPQLQRENWRDAITTIEKNHSPDQTAIIFAFDDPFAPWVWYSGKQYPIITTGTRTITAVSEIDTAMKTVLDYTVVITFDYIRDLTDPQHRTQEWLEKYGYSQAELYDYPNIGFIRVFRRQKVIGLQ